MTVSRMTLSRRRILAVLLCLSAMVWSRSILRRRRLPPPQLQGGTRETHTATLSGATVTIFPRWWTDWYKSHGYHFLTFSDHIRVANPEENDNTLMAGEQWRRVAEKGKKNRHYHVPPATLERCQKRFGNGWLALPRCRQWPRSKTQDFRRGQNETCRTE